MESPGSFLFRFTLGDHRRKYFPLSHLPWFSLDPGSLSSRHIEQPPLNTFLSLSSLMEGFKSLLYDYNSVQVDFFVCLFLKNENSSTFTLVKEKIMIEVVQINSVLT